MLRLFLVVLIWFHIAEILKFVLLISKILNALRSVKLCLTGLWHVCLVHFIVNNASLCVVFRYETWKITCKWQNQGFIKCQTNISPKHYLKRLKTKTELWKTVGLTSFQKPQLPSFLIFSKSFHPRLLYTSFSCSKPSVIYMFHSVCGSSSHWLNFDKFLAQLL